MNEQFNNEAKQAAHELFLTTIQGEWPKVVTVSDAFLAGVLWAEEHQNLKDEDSEAEFERERLRFWNGKPKTYENKKKWSNMVKDGF